MDKKRLAGLFFAPIFTYVFIVSGLTCSLLCLLLLVIWPFAKNLYRRVTSMLAYSIFAQIVWISTEWAGMNVTLFGEDEAFKNFGKESCLITLSHRGDLDWVAGYIMGVRFRFLHSIRTLPKWSVFYVPGFGQLLWSLECPFLTRSFAKDEKSIEKFSTIWETYPFPVQIGIFCEGTRFTTEKYEKGCQYAKEKGLPVLKHHLFPRTKGFALLAEHLKSAAKFKALYDIGFAYPNCPQKYIPSFIHLFLGNEVNLYWYMRRIPMEDLPNDHDELNAYCIKLYQHKDEAYEHFLQTGRFPGKVQQPPPERKWLLRFITLFWFLCVLVLPLSVMVMTLSWSTLGSLLLAAGLGNTLLLLGMLKYAQGARVVADAPHTSPEDDKKTD